MPVQLDFGGFDPSFLGVTLRFCNERAWRTYQESSQSPRPLPITSGDPDERFETLSLTSVISHECRHFHDFFLTPYSANVFRLRIQALLNLLQLLPALTASAGKNCIPVPVSKWCRLRDSERKDFLSRLPPRRDTQRWIPVEFPCLDEHSLATRPEAALINSPEGLKALTVAASYSLGHIRDFTYNPHMVSGQDSFQPWQVFELSGLLIQVQDVWFSYGPKETEFFIQYVMDRQRNPYGDMLRAVCVMWRQMKREVDLGITSVMTLWSLLGSYKKDAWKACPTVRFMRLWDHACKNGIDRRSTDPVELFDHWSRALRLSTVDEGLDDTLRTLRHVREVIQQRVLGIEDSFLAKTYGAFLFRVADGVVRASEHMVGEFRRNPSGYAYPHLYIEQASVFINPALRITTDGAGAFLNFLSSEDELSKKGYIVEWAIQQGDQYLIASIIAPYALSKFKFLDIHDVHKLSTMIDLTDFIFAQTARARADVQRAGYVWFSKTDLKPLEML